MIIYKEYENIVYNWLNNKNKQDPNFTFSLRKKSSKDTRSDYFVGTEKSRYFALTFWTIPISGYEGSSGDCINLVFKISADYRTYCYDLKLTQTNTPQDNQNSSVLNLIKSLTKPIKENIGTSYVSDLSNKTLTIRSKPKKEKYTNLSEMLNDIDENLLKFIPLVNKHIEIEKKKNPEFVAYRISQNEFQSMQEKLQKRFEKHRSLENIRTHNYWIFQGNPNIYDVTSALKAGNLKSWKVAAHKDKIQIGDQVIIWQTSDNAGCYALAEVTSEVSVLEEEEIEQQYYKNPSNSKPTERVTIKILKNLVEEPILWSDIKDDPVFIEFKAGNQGTNFSASQKEFDTLLNWDQLNDSNTFSKIREKIKPTIFNEYITFVRSVIKTIGLKPKDPRVVYSVRGYSLNFIIGQKYCINVYISKNKENFGVISTKRISKNSEEYAGKSPKTYYNYVNKLELNLEELETVIDATKGVLNKTTKSGYSKSNNSEFENFLFGIEIRNKEEITMQYPKNLILYGPPGTGKTYKTKKLALEIIETREYSDSLEDRKIILEKYETYVESEHIHFSTFHQSMSYEDFIEGIKPKMNGGDDDEISYEIQDGIFKSICSKAKRANSINEDDNFDGTWEKLIELVKTQISNDKLLKIGSWEYGLSSKESLKYSSLNTPSQYSFTITKQNIKDAYQNKKARPSVVMVGRFFFRLFLLYKT